MTVPTAGEPRRLRLWLEPDAFAICRLAPAAPVPAWALAAGVCSVTRTHEELSVVCPAALAPAPGELVDVAVDAPWRLLAVAGPLDFGLVGILRDLATVLSDAGVPVFVVSTYDTDLVLVTEAAVDTAVAALRGAGHDVRSSRRSAVPVVGGGNP